MTHWDPAERVTFRRRDTVAGVFIAACFFAAGVLLYLGRPW